MRFVPQVPSIQGEMTFWPGLQPTRRRSKLLQVKELATKLAGAVPTLEAAHLTGESIMTWEESERWFASLCVSGLPDDGVVVRDLVKFLEMSADKRPLSSWEKEVLGVARWSLQRHDPERN
jgi:hypothetical protein